MPIVRAAKLEEIPIAYNEIVVNDVDLTLDGETVHFNLNTEDQANVADLLRVVEFGGTESSYQADGGVYRVYTASEIATIYIAAQTLITTQTTYHNELRAHVQSLDSAETVTSIVCGIISSNLYNTETNEKLVVTNEQT